MWCVVWMVVEMCDIIGLLIECWCNCGYSFGFGIGIVVGYVMFG